MMVEDVEERIRMSPVMSVDGNDVVKPAENAFHDEPVDES